MSTPGGELPLVAREGELSVLRDALADASRGLGRAVCVVGPAGIGKTRLAAEVLRMGRDAGFRCAWGTGWPGAGVPPLWPWPSLLTQLGWSPDVLGTTDAQRTPDGGVDQERFTTFSAVAQAVASSATTQPVLIVIDDAHAADPGALLLARFLVRSLRASPLLVVMTARDMIGVDPVVHAAIDDLAQTPTSFVPRRCRSTRWPTSCSGSADRPPRRKSVRSTS